MRDTLSELSQTPIFYRQVLNLGEKFQAFVQSELANQNKELTQNCRMMLQGIEQFKKYHRCESNIANREFAILMELFLLDNAVSSGDCNVVEETLLRLAGASLGLHGKCRFGTGSDRSRMVFHFTDLSQENANKVIQYLQRLGDDSVIEGYGYSRQGSSIPESMVLESAMSIVQSDDSRRVKDYERHSIEMDGLCLLNKLLPELKKAIIDPKNAEQLDKYKALSAKTLQKKEAEKVKKDAFFQPPTKALSDDLDLEINNGASPE